ncbi:hypothetical protein GCM10010442_48330 [Kitasatospora kifunensis]
MVGGGIAGTMLAWRLVRHAGVEVDLVTGPDGVGDATRASGGLVRGFERDPGLAELARLSLRELRGSALLRAWSGYQETGGLYLLDEPLPEARLTELQRLMPGAVELLDRRELAHRFGLAGLPEGALGVLEHQAGYFSPDQLRTRAKADFAARGGSLDEGVLRDLWPGTDGVGYRTDRGRHRADVVVLAAGAWTGRLLHDCGLPPTGPRSKVIQYAVYDVQGACPPPFVDESSGLYGRPAGPGRMIFGLPTERWDVHAGPQPFMDGEERAVRRAVALRLPGLQVNPPRRFVAAAEAYVPQGRLALRPVPSSPAGLFTFAGGSGAAAKTALAAGAQAAAELLGQLGVRATTDRPSTDRQSSDRQSSDRPSTDDGRRPIPIPEGEPR